MPCAHNHNGRFTAPPLAGIIMVVHRTQRQQRAAAARAAALESSPLKKPSAVCPAICGFGPKAKDAASNPVVPANYQSPDAVLEAAQEQPSRRPDLRPNSTPRVITDASAVVQHSTAISRETTIIRTDHKHVTINLQIHQKA